MCLLPGTYRLTHELHITRGGTPASWVVYRSFKGRALVTAKAPLGGPLIQVIAPAAYLQFSQLSFDGGTTKAAGALYIADHTHHIRVLNNTIEHMTVGGIESHEADYVTMTGNLIYRFGDGPGWSSGISFNNGDGAWWYDRKPGFHNVIAKNVITGGVDNSIHHTDGNGIILDQGGSIPPTLIANNIVYMNGGRGIESFQISGPVYVINNTLYKNGLDLRLGGLGELVAVAATNQIWANNIVYAWNPRYTYLQNSSTVALVSDAQYGGRDAYGISTIASGQLKSAAPLFRNPPYVDPSNDLQWRTPPAPLSLGEGLALQSRSPLIDTATDPRTLPGLDLALLAGINTWVMTGIDGTPRPVGSGFDYGAYER